MKSKIYIEFRVKKKKINKETITIYISVYVKSIISIVYERKIVVK